MKLPTWLALLTAAPFAGSFLGVLIGRLPAGRPIVLSRSACEACGTRLAPRDLVPVLSWLALRGRCRTCAAAIGFFPLVVELAAIAVVGVAICLEDDPSRLVLDCGLGWSLLALAWIDARHMRLPDILTLPLIPVGLIVTLMRNPDDLLDRTLATIAGYLAFRAIEVGYRAWRGRDGLGQGDAKLLAATGAWVGLAQLADVVLGGALVTLAAIGLSGVRQPGRRLSAGTAVPFGPGLCLAFWLVWLRSP